MKYSQIISIHGAPRSGTSWLGQIFNKNSKVAYKFQPLFSYRFKDRLSLDSSPEETRAFFDELYEVNDDDFIAGNWPKTDKDSSLPNLTVQKDKQPEVLVMKEVRYHHLIEKWINTLPEIKIVGIVRNPCAVINSWLLSPKEFHREWNMMDEWRDAPSKNRGRIEEYNGYEKWKELALTFLDFERRYPERFILVQYEHLVSSPTDTIKDVFSFAGLDLEVQVIDFIKASQSYHIDDAYAVYKSPSVKDKWHAELDPRISEEIIKDVKGTVLEQFLA